MDLDAQKQRANETFLLFFFFSFSVLWLNGNDIDNSNVFSSENKTPSLPDYTINNRDEKEKWQVTRRQIFLMKGFC